MFECVAGVVVVRMCVVGGWRAGYVGGRGRVEGAHKLTEERWGGSPVWMRVSKRLVPERHC